MAEESGEGRGVIRKKKGSRGMGGCITKERILLSTRLDKVRVSRKPSILANKKSTDPRGGDAGSKRFGPGRDPERVS